MPNVHFLTLGLRISWGREIKCIGAPSTSWVQVLLIWHVIDLESIRVGITYLCKAYNLTHELWSKAHHLGNWEHNLCYHGPNHMIIFLTFVHLEMIWSIRHSLLSSDLHLFVQFFEPFIPLEILFFTLFMCHSKHLSEQTCENMYTWP